MSYLCVFVTRVDCTRVGETGSGRPERCMDDVNKLCERTAQRIVK